MLVQLGGDPVPLLGGARLHDVVVQPRGRLGAAQCREAEHEGGENESGLLHDVFLSEVRGESRQPRLTGTKICWPRSATAASQMPSPSA